MNRHDTSAEWSAEELGDFDGLIQTDVAALRHRTAVLNNLLITALGHFGHRCVVDPRAGNGDTWDSLCFAADVATAMFVAATTEKGKAVEVPLGGAKVPIKGTGPEYFATARNWLTALHLALITRDEAKIGLLNEVPVEVLRAADIEEPEFHYAVVEMFQRFNRQEPGVHEALNAALKGSKQVVPLLRDYTSQIAFPQLELFHHLSNAGHEEQFNTALAKALELHKAFWSTEEKLENPLGFVALGPLAIACVARDTGTPIDIESEYLPPHLLTGAWTVEGL